MILEQLEQLLKVNGWKLLGTRPLEIEKGNNYAVGEGANIILESLKTSTVSFSDGSTAIGEQAEFIKNSIKFEDDKIVEKVANKFISRSKIGIEKYGVTLERDDLNKMEWLTHLQEELMDATLYIETLKSNPNIKG